MIGYDKLVNDLKENNLIIDLEENGKINLDDIDYDIDLLQEVLENEFNIKARKVYDIGGLYLSRRYKLIEINHGKETFLYGGTIKNIVNYIIDTNLLEWILEEDPSFDLPTFENVSNVYDLKRKLQKVDLSWFELVVI